MVYASNRTRLLLPRQQNRSRSSQYKGLVPGLLKLAQDTGPTAVVIRWKCWTLASLVAAGLACCHTCQAQIRRRVCAGSDALFHPPPFCTPAL